MKLHGYILGTGLAIAGLIATWAFVYRPQDTPPKIVDPTQQAVYATPQEDSVSDPGDIASRKQVPRENEPEKYGLTLEGIVTRNDEPFSTVPVEMSIPSGHGQTNQVWNDHTGNDGTFTTPVTGGFFPYTIVATDYTTDPPRQRSVQASPGQFAEINFIDSPDVLIRVSNTMPIPQAFLTSLENDGKTLHSKITVARYGKGEPTDNTALFKDVQEAPYMLTLIVGDAVLQDVIPVIQEGGDIIRTYGLHSIPALPESTLFTGSVSEMETGNAIDTATLTFTLPNIDPAIYSHVVQTKDKGNFSDDFSQTSYAVTIAAPGYVTAHETIQIGENGSVGFVLKKGLYSLEGVVLANGNPVEGAEVYFVRPKSFSSKGALPSVTTNDKGAFAVDESLEVMQQPVAFKDGLYQKGHDLRNGRSILHMAKNNSTLEGRVFDALHRGIPAKVSLHLMELQSGVVVGNLAEDSLDRSVLTQVDGSYAFGSPDKPLPPGTYFMRVIPHVDVGDVVEKTREITLQGVTHQNVYLPRGISISGNVSWNNAPVGSAHVSFSTPGRGDITSLTDNEGEFTAIVPYGAAVEYFAWHHGRQKNGSFMPTANHVESIAFDPSTLLPISVSDNITGDPIQYYEVQHDSTTTRSYRRDNYLTHDGSSTIEIEIGGGSLKWLSVVAKGYEDFFESGSNIPRGSTYPITLDRKK